MGRCRQAARISRWLPATRRCGAFTGVHDNVLIIAGGANFPEAKPWAGGAKVYRNEAYVMRGDTVESFPLGRPAAYGASAAVPDGVVCIGGENASGPLPQVFLLQWQRAQKRVIAKNLPPLPFPLTNACATAIGSTVYVAGGENNDRVSDALMSIDLSAPNPVWKELARMPRALSHSVLVAQSDGSKTKLYLIGGRARTGSGISELCSGSWSYDPGTDHWKDISLSTTQKASQTYPPPRQYYRRQLHPGGRRRQRRHLPPDRIP